MEPLKEMFNVSYFKKLTSAVSDVYPLLDKKKFFNHLMVIAMILLPKLAEDITA